MTSFMGILEKEGEKGLHTLLEYFPEKIKEIDYWGDTPLTCAVKSKKCELINWLLQRGANPNSGRPSPLCCALQRMDSEMLELLLQNGVSANSDCCTWVRKKDYSLNGFPMREVIDTRQSPLFFLLYPGNRENTRVDRAKLQCTEILLAHGADVAMRNEHGNTLLHVVTDSTVLELLLRHGADPNARNAGGETPAFVAALQGQSEKATMLSRFGGIVDKQSSK